MEHNYGFNAWNGREWSHNWSSHFNPYSGRAVDHTDIARFGAYNGNFHAHVPETSVVPRSFDQHNVYGGGDGNVYRYNPSGTWERNTGQDGQRAPEAPRADLEQHALGGNMGEQRFNNFRSFGGGFSHATGGFAHGGGGGRR